MFSDVNITLFRINTLTLFRINTFSHHEAYIYGPNLPRSLYASVKLSF